MSSKNITFRNEPNMYQKYTFVFLFFTTINENKIALGEQM